MANAAVSGPRRWVALDGRPTEEIPGTITFHLVFGAAEA